MPRIAVCMGPSGSVVADQLDAIGATVAAMPPLAPPRPVGAARLAGAVAGGVAGGAVGGAAANVAFGRVEGAPGVTAGPFTVGAYTAAGDVTLHNRGELAVALAVAGAPTPPGCCDGELLLRVYARLGLAGVALAEGMFVLAVADGDGLVLIRDHVGARSMFYAWAGGCWLASASLRALRRWPALRTGLNLAAVRSFLTFAYLPGPETLLRGVAEVPPGRCLRLARDGTVAEEAFWEPVEALGAADAGTYAGVGVDVDAQAETAERYATMLRAELDAAVARRLPPAERIGVLLSGGVDSSLVTALAAKLHDAPVDTYSISFGGDAPNELAYSGLVATHCHTGHRVLTVGGDTVAARLADTVALLDSPVGDPLTVPNMMLAEAVAADGIRVVLNGEGGDPVFGGPKNLPMLVWEMQRDDPGEMARALAYLRSYRKCHADLPVLLSAAATALLREVPGPEHAVAPYLRPGRMESILNQLLHCNLRTKGAYHILPKVERITSVQGLSGRAPLFDRRVIDAAFSVPPRLKLAGSTEKWVLKRAVADVLPATIVERPKSGMRVPVQQWLSGPLRELAGDVLLGPASRERGLFRLDTVRTWMRGEGAVQPRQGGKLWLVLTLELWLRSFDVGP